MRFCIRDFHNADFEMLWRIDQQCFAPGISYSAEELEAYLNFPGSFTIVADAGDPAEVEPQQPEILGFVVGHLNRAHAGHIITIDVIPKAQRAGVGSELLRAAEDRLTAQGCKWIRLEAAVDNASALSFYKRFGYTVARTIPAYYPNGVDAYVLKKDLPSAGLGR